MREHIESESQDFSRTYWPKGLPGQLAMGLCGIIAILVALKAAAYQPSEPQFLLYQDDFFRVLSFAALTIWTTFAIGLQRRGPAAIIALGFAVFTELILLPIRGEDILALPAANFGIVLAYCGMQLYWLALSNEREPDVTVANAI